MSTPTDTSNQTSGWRQRSFGAHAIKALAFAIPVAASILWTIVVGQILPDASGFVGHLIWWTIIAGGAIVVAMLVERAARRMLPMAMLLRLALVFPEAAPSRFSMALRANSTRQLKRRIEEGIIDETSTPQEAATALLELSAALSVHDRMTRGHAERVRAYAVMIGEQLELQADELNKLQWAALLHDVGKLDVDSAILNKPGKPNEEELKSLRQHPDRGREYMGALGPWLGEWALAAWEHHERFDGTGYPAQLDGDEISLAARIVSVADSYDVMTSTRSYKSAMDPQSARAELLACSGTQFDPEVVRAFLSVPVSELRRPFQAALGAGALASLAQLAEIRTIATSAAAFGTAVVATTFAGAAELPRAIAFADETPLAVEIIEDSPLEIPLRTTIAADSYTLDSVDGPATATIIEDTLLIEPEAEQSGTVTVVLTACSGDTCDTTAIVAEVVAVNDAPFASADSATIDALQDSISIPVLANDTDVDSGELSIESSQVTIGDGSVEVSGDRQELLFTPTQGSIGPWTIEYVVTDGGNGFDRGTVTILDGDLAPEAIDDVATVVVGESVNIDARANDRDDGGVDRLVIIDIRVIGAASSQAEVSIDAATGTLLFSPGPTPGVVTVEYTIQDRMLRESTAQILVEVTPIVPVAADDSALIEQDTSATVNVLANDGPSSLDLATADLRIVSNSEGTVEVANGEITYTPPPNAVGEASVVYEVCSGPQTCDTATLKITVTEVQTQTFRAEGQLAVPAAGGPQLIPWAVVSAGRDAIAPGTTFSIRTDSPGLFITPPAISSTGSVTFEPRPTASGIARTTVTVTDSAGTREYRLRLSIS